MKPMSLRRGKRKSPLWPRNALAVVGVALLGWLPFGLPATSQAAQFTVQMTGTRTFNPNYLEIQVGDTVTWVNQDSIDTHDTVSTDGYWSSPLLDFGQTYALTFPVTGIFPYEDSFYGPLGMTGTIVVSPPPPPVLISPKILLDRTFQFTVTNLMVGKTNVIQASLGLTAWTNLVTNVAASSSYTFVDQTAVAFGRRYYRVVALP